MMMRMNWWCCCCVQFEWRADRGYGQLESVQHLRQDGWSRLHAQQTPSVFL